jgi:hypothetical protein
LADAYRTKKLTLLLSKLDEDDEVRVTGGSLKPSIGKSSGACGWPVAADKAVRAAAVISPKRRSKRQLPATQILARRRA